MEEEKLSSICELMEQSAHVTKLLITSEIQINDGDVVESQKTNKEIQNISNIMIDDSIKEFLEVMNIDLGSSADYDYPNALELARQFSEVNYCCANLITLLNNNDINMQKVIINKICSHLSAVVEIISALYNN